MGYVQYGVIPALPSWRFLLAPVRLVRYAGNSQVGEVHGYLSEPRPGLVDAMMGLAPTMRLLTVDPLEVQDVLQGADGSRYRVVRVHLTPAGLLAELAKEA